MNLVRLTPEEARKLSQKVGDLHAFKSHIMHTSRDISEFDIFKDIDSGDKDIYVALKNNPYSNYENATVTLY